MKKRMMNKSGQFYLITAVILAGVIIGISAISNYSKKEKNPGLDELKEEIKIESSRTLDYATNNKLSSDQMYILMQNFTRYYVSSEKRGGKDLYFLFGNSNNLTVSGYQGTSKVVSISSGSSQLIVTQTSGNFTGSINPAASNVVLDIDGNQNTFSLSQAENFHFVMTQNVDGGEYVVKE